jgi:4-amino-4-deoxy-L-arabinose transferase-like glycosyltransferase
MKLKPTQLFLAFLGALFLLNLLQSTFTELLFDEAYYWYFSREMAWGYFDHPPMVALLVKISGLIFKGELGVRFMSCLLSAGTLGILWKTLDHPDKGAYIPHFFALVFSMTLLNAYGFFTLPDTPLLFFTALFLLLYKHFLQRETLQTALGLGVVIAALMYSKYHAVLVILFVIVSNIRLLRSPKAWLAVALALILYVPHLLWLSSHDFVSIRYHLFERPNRAYDFNDFTLGYFINLIALFGFTFPWVYLALYRTKSRDLFTRSLLFLVYGILLFFFVSSFQRRVQTQWIIIICIPMVPIVFRYLADHAVFRKWLMRAALVNVALLLFLRAGLVFEPLFPVHFETHGNKKWVGEIAGDAGDIPVIFENSYRSAPMYAFYSGHTSYSLNNVYYRENQYNIDGSEAMLQHKRVLLISGRYREGDMSYNNIDGELQFGKYIEDFESYRELECSVGPLTGNAAGQRTDLYVYNPYSVAVPLEKLKFAVAFMNEYKQVTEVRQVDIASEKTGQLALAPGDTTALEFIFPESRKEVPAYFRMAISDNGLYWGINGNNIKL